MTDASCVIMPSGKFPLGQIVFTQAVDKTVCRDDTAWAVIRHCLGDWGDVSQDDRAANDWALLSGGRLHSVYHDRAGVAFWIITEADRSVTTVLLPDDY
jgi:hypothetical protein